MDLNNNCRWPKADVEQLLSLTMYQNIQKIHSTDSSALIPLQQARKIQKSATQTYERLTETFCVLWSCLKLFSLAKPQKRM
jgi:hypothetical protein